MTSVPRGRVLALLAVPLAVLLAAVLGFANPAQAQRLPPINGSGSTWSFNALNSWIGDVSSNGITVNFNPVGSTQGRANFAAGTTDFGVTEIPYQGTRDEQGKDDNIPSRGFAYMPIVAGGTAFMYNIQVRGQAYEGLRLSGETLARIFTGDITRWNDEAITEDNNGVELPDKQIIPVVRSDGSGTTAQFTTYLDEQYPDIWRPFLGRSGLTSYFPNPDNRFVAQNGSDGVQRYVSADYGDGTIGYVEYSYALERDWPVAKVLNEAGYYVLPTQYNVAVALTRAEIETEDTDPAKYLTQDLTGVYRHSDQRAYPLSSYSYMIVPTDNTKGFSDAKGTALSRFAFYFLCEGQQRAGSLGYSPLPLNLVLAGFDQVHRIPGNEGDALTDPSKCNNPTFDGADPDRNLLAEIAPAIPDCDRKGQGPCGEETDDGTGNGPGGDDGTGGTNGPGGTDGNGTGPGGTDGTGTNGEGTGTSGGVEIDPETGLPVGTAGEDGEGLGPAALASADAAALPVSAAVLAAAQLAAILIVPTVLARYLARRNRLRHPSS